MEASKKHEICYTIPLKKLILGTYETDDLKMDCFPPNDFEIKLPDESVIELNINDISKLKQNFEAGNNYFQFSPRPPTANRLSNKIPAGFKYYFYSKKTSEKLFMVQFADELDDEIKSSLQNMFSSITPYLPDENLAETVDQSSVEDMEIAEILAQEGSNKKKAEEPADEAGEYFPAMKKIKKRNEGSRDEAIIDNNGIRDSPEHSLRPSRSLRSKSKQIKYSDIDPNDYFPDDDTIPEQLRDDIPAYLLEPVSDLNGNGIKSESKPAICQPFYEYDNSIELVTYHNIVIRMEDYKCLDRRGLLTDVILDFYLMYIYQELMTEEQRQKTHIYTTHFYSLYATSPNYSGWKDEENKDLSAMEKRYKRVKGLPCNSNVNIFEKDFVIFPCIDREHWFLAIACFPKLNGSVTINGNVRVEGDDTRRDMRNPDAGEPTKSSCILAFDSVRTNPGRRTAATQHIRRFISSVYLDLYQNDFPYEEKEIKSHGPKCPFQTNATDCGLFVLEFMERFFVTSPINDYRLPMDLSSWFDPSIIALKREHIANIIKGLMMEATPGEELPELPPISFNSESEDVQFIEEVPKDENGNENGNNNQEEFNNNNDFNFVDNNVDKNGVMQSETRDAIDDIYTTNVIPTLVLRPDLKVSLYELQQKKNLRTQSEQNLNVIEPLSTTQIIIPEADTLVDSPSDMLVDEFEPPTSQMEVTIKEVISESNEAVIILDSE